MNILQGLRIVELADEIAGPYCGNLFADSAPKSSRSSRRTAISFVAGVPGGSPPETGLCSPF